MLELNNRQVLVFRETGCVKTSMLLAVMRLATQLTREVVFEHK